MLVFSLLDGISEEAIVTHLTKVSYTTTIFFIILLLFIFFPSSFLILIHFNSGSFGDTVHSLLKKQNPWLGCGNWLAVEYIIYTYSYNPGHSIPKMSRSEINSNKKT